MGVDVGAENDRVALTASTIGPGVVVGADSVLFKRTDISVAVDGMIVTVSSLESSGVTLGAASALSEVHP